MAKSFIHLFVIASTAILVSAQEKKKSGFNDHQLETWSVYKYEYNRHYDYVEDMHRMETFFTNLAFIKKPKKHYQSAINNFADQTVDELRALHGFKEEYARTVNCEEKYKKPHNHRKIPEYVNWAERGFVSPVRNQGKCASDYAFSAVGALESRKAILENNAVTELSVQNLLDCTRFTGNIGCYGGYPTNIYMYISEGNAVYSNAKYPYVGISSKCQTLNSTDIRIGLLDSACISLKPGDEEELKEAVALYGPVSIVFKASYSLFFYKSGIYNDPNCEETDFNHPVLVVGYGTDKSTKTHYWIIKNSWGADWGENGYFRTLRNSYNHCGVASIATLPAFKSCS